MPEEIEKFTLVKNVAGKKCKLHRDIYEAKICEFRISAFSCDVNCVCDGYEVCLHLLHTCGQGPIWPIFNARSIAEAKEIQTKLIKFASTIDPNASMRVLENVLGCWAYANGWEKTHHIVWRHPSQKEQ